MPSSVSPEAQAVLAMPTAPSPERPPIEDLDGWRAMIREHDQSIAALMAARTADAPGHVEERDVRSVHVYEIAPNDLADGDPRIFLDVHGGESVFGAGECCRAMAVAPRPRSAPACGPSTTACRRTTRSPPGSTTASPCTPLLAGHRPEEIIVGGPSAGGNLAAALILRARDEGLPFPPPRSS